MNVWLLCFVLIGRMRVVVVLDAIEVLLGAFPPVLSVTCVSSPETTPTQRMGSSSLSKLLLSSLRQRQQSQKQVI